MLATEFKMARGRGVPLVAVATSDPAETLKTIVGACNGSVPVACWDVATGIRNCNEAAVQRRLAEDIGGAEEDDTQNDPKLFVTRISDSRLCPPSDDPTGFVVVMMMANRFFTDDKDGRYIVQAIANLRDPFKGNRCCLVMLGHGFVFPPELQADIMLIDEPLPNRERLEGIAAECASNAAEAAGKPMEEYMPSETLGRLADAVSGLPAFAAEQVVALSLSPKGCDVGYAWQRKRKQIEATPGLSVHQGGETFADIGGVTNVKDYLGKILRGAKAPKAIIYLDEIEKSMAGVGHDTSGVSQDFLGVILAHMQDHEAAGMIFVGPPGCSKSLVAKAAGSEISAPTIKLDLGAAKGQFVGQSENQIRNALKVIDAVSDGKALWLATCNGIASLPPELRRRFTLGTFFFDLPDANERSVIWKIWLKRAFGKSVPKGNFHAQSEGWTGAEIKQAVDIMERTGLTFDEARQYVVPVSVSAADQIESLRRSASGRYLSASKPGIYYHAGEKGALESGKRAIKFDT